MRCLASILIALAAVTLAEFPCLGQDGAHAVKIVEVRKIWDAAPHNAFTDLVRYKDQWFCAFREGKAHVSPDGALRVITSRDGATWESAALVKSDLGDLRDAKLAITPEGKLMLAGAVALPQPNAVRHKSLVWFSDDGKTWSDGRIVGDDNYWLWRVTFSGKNGYGVGYRTVAPRSARLYITKDNAQSFEALVPKIEPVGWAGEHDLSFAPDGTATCLLRRDPPPKGETEGVDDAGRAGHAVVGVARPPYTNWQWKDLKTRIGGPAMIRLADGRLLAVVRLYDKKARTSLCWLDADKGTITEAVALPSGGDTSYAGLVMHEGVLWISYYSSHEKKTSIYLAKVDLKGT
jgi:hypothetical protein